MRATTLLSLILPFLAARSSAGCTPNTTDTSTLQSLLRSGGAGYTLQLCQGQVYNTTDILNYTASDQVSDASPKNPDWVSTNGTEADGVLNRKSQPKIIPQT